MLKKEFENVCSGFILSIVRGHRGWLSFVSSESQINRRYFSIKQFPQLKFFQLLRVLYALSMQMDRDEFSQLGRKLFNYIWDEQDYLGYDLLDEYKNSSVDE